jgi:hypothetical protein
MKHTRDAMVLMELLPNEVTEHMAVMKRGLE